MNAFDIFALVLFIAGAIYGFRKGIIVQIGSFGGVLVGIICCRMFNADLADLINPWLSEIDGLKSSQYIGFVIANVLLFLAGYFLTRLLAGALKKLVHALFLGIFDKIAGAVFAVFSWFLLLSLALNVWQAFSDTDIKSSSIINNAKSAAAIIDFAPNVLGGDTADQLFAD